MDGRDVCIVANLYWNQTVSFRVCSIDNRILYQIRSKQGCILLSLLFNDYSEKISEEAFSEQKGRNNSEQRSYNHCQFNDNGHVMSNFDLESSRLVRLLEEGT